MGNIMRIPIQPAPTSFLHWSLYNPAGEPMKEHEWQYAPGQQLVNTDALFLICELFCQPLLDERLQKISIKNKFLDANVELLSIQFPTWTSDQIRDLKAEFQLFDAKKTGVISLENVSKVLDDLGDTSSFIRREQVFLDCDDEEKGLLDFEQYLQFLSVMQEAAKKADSRRFTVSSTKYGGGAVRRLSILNQISSGIF